MSEGLVVDSASVTYRQGLGRSLLAVDTVNLTIAPG